MLNTKRPCKPSIFWTVALFLGQLDHRFGQNDSILKQIEGANGFETFAWDEWTVCVSWCNTSCVTSHPVVSLQVQSSNFCTRIYLARGEQSSQSMILNLERSFLIAYWSVLVAGLRVSGSRNGVSGSRGVFFPGMVFSVPGGFGGSQGVFSSRAGVFSVPRFGFAVPGMVCWAPVGVFCSRNGVSGSRPEGTAWRCLWFPYGVSSCFFLLLCFSLFVASFLFFPFCPFLTSCYFCFLSSVPAFPLPFLFLRFL